MELIQTNNLPQDKNTLTDNGTTVKTISKMRTINETVALIKAADPDTAINYNIVKTLITENKIRYFTVGKKIILNYDDLLKVINEMR